jgi:ABC-2 type transport system permease protein
MFRRVLIHDWRTLRADFTIAAVAVIFGVSLAYGLFNGLRWTNQLERALDTASAEERTRFGELQAETARLERDGGSVAAYRDPRNPSVLGQSRGARYAMLPPLSLTPLAIGQSDLLPSYYRMSTDARESVLAAVEIENPRALMTGRFDLAFVIIYLYPLLILVLSYNLLSAEKEQGTLPLTLSQPVSLATLVKAKVTLRGLLIAGLAIVVSVAGLILMQRGAGMDAAFRLVLWSLLVAAYGAFWFALAVFVTAFGKGSATNAMTLAACWLVGVVVVPAAMNLGVTTIYPVPSRVQMIQAIRTASDSATADGSRVLARYYEDHPELVSAADRATNDFNALRVAVNVEVERRVRPVVDRYEQQLAAQQRSVGVVRYLSPAIVAQDALSDLAGTGVARHQHFLALVDAYHRQWRQFFTPLVLQKARVTNHAIIPAFSYTEEPLAAVVGRSFINLMAFVIPAIALAGFGLWRIRRFPVLG